MEASTEHRRAKDSLDTELAAASANDELIRLWAEAANIQAAKGPTQSTLTELLEGTVAPLAAEIHQQWTSLFPDRGGVTTTPGGQITHTVNGIDLVVWSDDAEVLHLVDESEYGLAAYVYGGELGDAIRMAGPWTSGWSG